MDICSGDGIFIPATECDACEAYLSRVEAVENDVENLEATKQDILTPGNNITIVDGVISATGGGGGASYTAGDGIAISNNVISAQRNPNNTYTKTEVDNLLSDLERVQMRVVTALPTTGESNVIYLLQTAGGGYEQYIWATVGGTPQWVDIGEEAVDLSGYLKTVDAETTYQKKLTAGTNVQISNTNVISATDTTYAAGTGITISGANNTIAADRNASNTYTKTEVDDLLDDKQDSLSAGTAINIASNTVSVKANSKTDPGYVAAGGTNANKVWKTDANGNPAWRDDAGTTYTAGTALTLDSNNEFDVQLVNGVGQSTAGQKALDAVQANPLVAGTFAARTKGVFAPNSIPDGADLNTYITPGEYHKGTNVGTLVNCPVTSGIRLTVETTGSYATAPGWIRQTVWSPSGTDPGIMYTRTTINATAATPTWTAWRKFLFTNDLTQSKAITAVGTKAVDAVELNANVANTYAKSVADKFAAIGAAPVPTADASQISVESGTSKTLCSLTIPANARVLVFAGVLFEPNAAGTRKFSVGATTSVYDSPNKTVACAAATSGRTALQISYLFHSSADTTLYLNVWQNSGAAINCSAQMHAMKLNQ